MLKLQVVLAAAATTVLASTLAAQEQPAQRPAAGLEVGAIAPDFTIPGATRYGTLAQPVKLSDYRGQTVVLAFFPRARTRGCTFQMEAYRDRYATLYRGGRNVVVMAVSTDPDTTLAAWARELETPVLFGSDSAQTAAKAYGAAAPGRNSNARHLYVIAPDGRIAHRQVPFNELAEVSYVRLGEAIARLAPR